MRRPINEKEKALLDEMSRATDPREEAIQQLLYEIEHGDPITRRAFVAEIVRNRRAVEAVRRHVRRLPPAAQGAVRDAVKAKSFEHLVALAESRGEAPPELEPGALG